VFFEAPHRIQTTLHELEREVGDCQIVVCRELTKFYEEFVRGSLSAVAHQEFEGRGEFTVVINIGQTTDVANVGLIHPSDIVAEFGVMTKIAGTTKRMAINSLGKRFGIPPNRIYAMLEEAKKSGV
jgi:16S rRNA (cytidine1402-2'-O)-methyltransferase